jgi:LysM repeat protein
MKIGSAVLGLHIAALVAFSLTQGCVTTESQGSGRGAGAKHKGPWKHEHKGKVSTGQAIAAGDSIYPENGQSSDFEPVIIDTESLGTTPEPYVAPVPSYGDTETYIVQKGDILSRLAVEFDTTTQTLIDMNNLSNPDVLYVGQELRVPAGSRRTTRSISKAPVVQKGGEYVIRKGDTLSGIAVAAGVSLNDLRNLNNIQDDKIYAGDTIYIPRGGTVPTNTQKTVPKETEPVEPAESIEPEPAPMAGSTVEPVETDNMQVDAVIDHLVYPDETLDEISRQYGVSKSDIMRLNNISDEFSLKEGQRLRIPISE